MDNLIELYYKEIKNGNVTINEVPNKLKDSVQEKLNLDTEGSEQNA